MPIFREYVPVALLIVITMEVLFFLYIVALTLYLAKIGTLSLNRKCPVCENRQKGPRELDQDIDIAQGASLGWNGVDSPIEGKLEDTE